MPTLDPGNDTLVRRAVLARTSITVLVLHHQRITRAVHDDVLVLVGKLFPLHIEWNRVFLGNCFEHALEILRVCRSPRRNRTLKD